MNPNITELIQTTSQAYQLIDRLEELNSGLYSRNLDVQVLSKKLLPSQLYEPVLKYLEVPLTFTNAQIIQKRTDDLINSIKSLPVISLEIALEPNQKQIERLSSIVSLYCQKKVLLDIVVKHNIIGGAVIKYQGRFFDATIKANSKHT